MINRRLILLFIVSAIALGAFAATTFKLSDKERMLITEEAENWIDNMPEGLQDRLSDAIIHAMRGFYSEIQAFRNLNDTINLNNYPVEVKEFRGGESSDILMRFYEPLKNNSKQTPLLIYFHGGGWTLGSLNSTEKFCRALTAQGNLKVISVDYPLAPEHSYPSDLKISKEAVNYIFDNAEKWGVSKDVISLGGDGAGGNIALATFESLPEKIKIKSLVLYYPLIKTTGELNANLKRQYGRGYGFDSRLWESFIMAYNGREIKNCKVLPSVLIISAGRDIVLNEAEEFAKNKGVVSIVFEDALHGFITDGQQKTAFQKAVEITDSFLMK